MTFIETATEGTAAGTAAQLRTSPARATWPTTRAFALRPEVLAGLGMVNGAIKHAMDLRRYELANSPPHAPCAQPTAPWPTAGCCGTGSDPEMCAASPPTTPAPA